MSGDLKAVAQYKLKPGQSINYHGIRIGRNAAGQLKINSQTDPLCVEVDNGVGGSCRIVVILSRDKVQVFEGASGFGKNAISKNAVLEAFGLAACH